jgi:DNA/RNA-binding protein KIN17
MSDLSKHRGLGKLKFYCQLCSKQCRDANGLKNHSDSESHKAKLELFRENPDKFVSEFSDQFEANFLEVLREISRNEWHSASEAYKEIVKDPDHVHLNATKWKDFTEFLGFITEKGLIRRRPRDRGGVEIQIVNKELEERSQRLLKDEKRRLERSIQREDEEIGKRLRNVMETSPPDEGVLKNVSSPTELQRTDPSAKIKFSFGMKPMNLKR